MRAMQSRYTRVVIPVVAVAIYTLLFFALYPSIGASVGSLAVIPAVSFAYFWGMRGGFVAGLLSFPLNTLLLNFVTRGEVGLSLIPRQGTIPGTLALLLIGGVVGRLTDLRNQVKREFAAREYAENELDGIVSSIPDYVWSGEGDSEGNWTYYYYSSIVEKITGRPPEFYMDSPAKWLSTIHSEDRKRVEAALRKVLNGRAPRVEEEYRIVLPDGRIRWVRDRVRVTRLDGNKFRADGVVSDVTEYKEAEMARQESSERLSSILETAMDAIITVDSEYKITLFNPAAESVFGYGAEEVIGESINRFLPSQFRELHDDHVQQFAQSGLTRRSLHKPEIITGLRANGEEFVAEASIGRAVIDDQVFMTVIMRDITERKKGEEALSLSEASYRSLFENVLDGIYRSDLEGELLTANPALVHMLGYETEEALKEVRIAGKVFAKPQDRDRWLEKITEQGTCINFEIVLKRKDGQEITVLDNSRLVFDSEGNSVYIEGTLTDITTLRKREGDLVRAYDATIEGWSRAVDLRDHETEGHSQRVAYITVQLAEAMGVEEEVIVHVRRGALLHDIGKLAIPDEILYKPGELSQAEWAVMHKHPEFAHVLLQPIEYLRPAIDIPFCHHEKWDGSGYPRGLKGAAIPLAARVFAVADVWDALLSSRPYRGAWEEEKVLEYIKKEAGGHFDPKVIEVFLANYDRLKRETGAIRGTSELKLH